MLMMVNVDDDSCETVPFIIDELMKKGAGSVHVVPALTKKGRPEHIYFIDASEDLLEDLAAFMAAELGTIGVRVLEHRHIRFSYSMVMTRVMLQGQNGFAAPDIRVKAIRGTDRKILHVKADFDDLKPVIAALTRAGESITMKSLKSLVELAVFTGSSAALGKVLVEITGEDEDEKNPASVG